MKFLCTALILVTAFSSALAGTGQDKSQDKTRIQTGASPAETRDGTTPPAPPADPSIWVYLVGGGRMRVDEVTERADGLWYKRGNVMTFLDRQRVERIDRSAETKPASLNKTQAAANWRLSDAARVERFFIAKFERQLPLTAFGQSELHNRWGLDHRQGMDVGLHPDSSEGKALITFLRGAEIPFMAFRGPVPGVATGPHIHIGNRSLRLMSR